MEKYNHKKVEKYWQKKWKDEKLYKTGDKQDKPKYYILDMFPYPSGDGLHVGHPKGYIATDILARMKMMQGYNVLHPMGWDAFGLPAENYAIKNKVHPKIATEKNIKIFKNQLEKLGFTYDWDKEINTTDPKFYRWTQWIFLQMFKKGLAYESYEPINWCPGCQTGLANEDLEDGKCERCGSEIEQKPMRQWVLKITDYADRMLKDLDKLSDWENSIKEMQKNWIGRSEGASVKFNIRSKKLQFNKIYLATGNKSKIERFKKLCNKIYPDIKVEQVPKIIDVEETKDSAVENAVDKIAVYKNKYDCPVIAGDTAVFFNNEEFNPTHVKRICLKNKQEKNLTQDEISEMMVEFYKNIARKNGGEKEFYYEDGWALLMPNGTIKKTSYKREYVLTTKEIGERKIYFPMCSLYYSKTTGKRSAEQLDDDYFEEFNCQIEAINYLFEDKIEVFTTRPDTLFGCTYMVVSPEYKIIKNNKSQITNYKEVEKYIESAKMKSEIDRADDTKEKTGVELKGIKAINPANKEGIPIFVADYVLSGYGTGAIMAVPAHDERDFEFAKKYNLEIRQVVAPHFIDYNNPHIKGKEVISRKVVHCVIKHWKKDEIIILDWKKQPWKTFITGGIRKEEDMIDAAIREIKEETGYKNIKFIKKIGWEFHSEFFASHKNINRYACCQGLYFELENGDQNEISEEEKNKHKVVWTNFNKVKEKLTSDDIKIMWDKLQDGETAFTGEGVNINSDFPDEVLGNTDKKKVNCIIIHGSSFNDKEKLAQGASPINKRNWIPIIKMKLEKRGIETDTPLMPKNWEPNYNDWKKEFEKLKINENSILIGHSAGGAFLVRWLGETKRKIKKLILVAPAWSSETIPEDEPKFLWNFYEFGIDKKIKERVNEIIIFVSNDERDTIKKSVEVYSKKLNITPIVLNSRGHFCVSGNSINKEFFELSEEILKVKCFDSEGINTSSDFLNGLKTNEAKEKMIKWLEKNEVGKKSINYKLKDWVFSRQRYWGEPIPIIHCKKCGAVAVPEKDLPVKLPEVKNYEPSGTGESPLVNIKKWVNTKCPKCNEPAKRETNTMPQWAGSSWYYLRYIDPKNDEVLVNKEKEKYWSPIDFYVGGAEHATRHLIYARFWHKFLYDIGVVNYEEPFKKLRHVGLIMAEDGRKMSKRWGNVINPDEIVEKYGADSMRVYEMFMGPFSQPCAWNTNGLIGARKFINKIYEYFEKNKEQLKKGNEMSDTTPKVKSLLHKTIKKVTEDIKEFKFNTAISQMMIFLNSFYKTYDYDYKKGGAQITRETDGFLRGSDFKKFLKLLAPFAPFMAEELWLRLENKKSIFKQKWPEYNPELIKDEIINLAIQINGKFRGTIEVEADISEDEAKNIALENEKIIKWIENKKIIKTIFIKGRLINFIMK